MSWLKKVVGAGIVTRSKKDVKTNVWHKCTGCGDMIYQRDLAENIYVCPNCGQHEKISLQNRFEYLFDDDSIQDISVSAPKHDPLKFKDRKSYSDRLKDARKQTKSDDAFRVATAKIKGEELVVCAFNFDFMAGSMGTYVGEAIVVAAQTAVEKNLPLLIVPASGGARMQEGILSLMQMVRSTAAIAEVKDAKLPYIVMLTHPTTGGVTASFAMEGDILIGEPQAMIGFAGARVIQQTIGETLPEGFQTAEYLLEHGMLDMVTPRNQQAETIANILSIMCNK